MAPIRRLDEMVMDQGTLLRPGRGKDLGLSPLLRPAGEFERLGDLPQAERARVCTPPSGRNPRDERRQPTGSDGASGGRAGTKPWSRRARWSAR